ncbi:PTS sugar transporter subunit IIA [Vagococcus fluvialis]|uniref:PTS sugar transporter subunit IIA n=1 Tax=Vagococcus fluvialis TaxID=2738 RepID=UPI001A8E1DC5|nr:hypothetical protein [Vagococcus fluvialis]MBO0438421.1 hypothetical protein [Vagococcus fluvialis]
MNNIVLVSHGDMAEGVKSSLEMIVGEQPNVFTVSLRTDVKQFETDLLSVLEKLEGKVLVIADLLGGTPANTVVKHFLTDENVLIISGMSLPLVIEASLITDDIDVLIEVGKNGVTNVKEQMALLSDCDE